MKLSEVKKYQRLAKEKFNEFGIPIKKADQIEIADFGLGDFEKCGLYLVVKVNNEHYCSKWLLLMPGQRCPEHHHKNKTETFFILRGKVKMELKDKTLILKPGDQLTLYPGDNHAFSSKEWALIEEVSTHDEDSDSYFKDPRIIRTPIIEKD